MSTLKSVQEGLLRLSTIEKLATPEDIPLRIWVKMANVLLPASIPQNTKIHLIKVAARSLVAKVAPTEAV